MVGVTYLLLVSLSIRFILWSMTHMYAPKSPQTVVGTIPRVKSAQVSLVLLPNKPVCGAQVMGSVRITMRRSPPVQVLTGWGQGSVWTAAMLLARLAMRV